MNRDPTEGLPSVFPNGSRPVNTAIRPFGPGVLNQKNPLK